jgi:hypothetical protein
MTLLGSAGAGRGLHWPGTLPQQHHHHLVGRHVADQRKVQSARDAIDNQQ